MDTQTVTLCKAIFDKIEEEELGILMHMVEPLYESGPIIKLASNRRPTNKCYWRTMEIIFHKEKVELDFGPAPIQNKTTFYEDPELLNIIFKMVEML